MQARKTSSTNYLNQSFLENKCPLNELLFLLSKRWVTETLFCIEEGNSRFSAIRNSLEHISDHILADRLKLLESAGFVKREILYESPVKVEYSLTERGAALSSLLDNMCQFASAEGSCEP